MRVMAEFRRGARLDNVEVRWKRKDGSAITVRLSGRVVNNPEETAEVVEKKPGVRERERQTPISSSPRGPRPEYVDNGAK